MTDAISSTSSTTTYDVTERKGNRNRLHADMAADPLYTMGGSTIGDTYEFGMTATNGTEEDYVVGSQTPGQKQKAAQDEKAQTKANLEAKIMDDAKTQAKDEAAKTEGDVDKDGRTEDEVANDIAEENIARANDHIEQFGIHELSWITVS